MGWQRWSACSLCQGFHRWMLQLLLSFGAFWGFFVLRFWPLMRMKCSLGLIVYSCDRAVLKTVNLSSLFTPRPHPPSQFCDCRLLQALCGYFGQIHFHVSHMTWCHLDYLLFSHCPLLLSSLLQKYRPVWVSCKVFTWFPIVCFHYFILIVRQLISLVLTLPQWTETKNKHLIITWLSSALFFFKDGADHPWPLNCLSASLRWRPWKWSIVLIKVLKVLNAVYRPDVWWHWRGCGQNFNTVKWKHS